MSNVWQKLWAHPSLCAQWPPRRKTVSAHAGMHTWIPFSQPQLRQILLKQPLEDTTGWVVFTGVVHKAFISFQELPHSPVASTKWSLREATQTVYSDSYGLQCEIVILKLHTVKSPDNSFQENTVKFMTLVLKQHINTARQPQMNLLETYEMCGILQVISLFLLIFA